MFKIIKKLFNNDQGQALVLVALALVVLIGFAAVAIDYGYLAWQRRNLQNAADSAALAAAWELPNDTEVRDKAREFARKNVSELTNEEIEHAILNDNKEVRVDVKHTYNTFLGGILGSSNQQISATATAEKFSIWAGEAIPFLNFSFDYSTEDSTGRYHVDSGQKGTILNFTIRNWGQPNLYFEIDYTNGINVAPGQGNHHDENGNSLNDGLKQIINKENEGKIFYQFSLRDDIIRSGEFTVNGGTKTIKLDELQQLDNKDVVDPEQLVLIEVILIGAKYQNTSEIEVGPTGRVYNLVDEFPSEHITFTNSSRLIN